MMNNCNITLINLKSIFMIKTNKQIYYIKPTVVVTINIVFTFKTPFKNLALCVWISFMQQQYVTTILKFKYKVDGCRTWRFASWFMSVTKSVNESPFLTLHKLINCSFRPSLLSIQKNIKCF